MTKNNKDAKETTYYLRGIPRDLWIEVKHRAVDEGLSLRAMIFRGLETYLKETRKQGGDNV